MEVGLLVGGGSFGAEGSQAADGVVSQHRARFVGEVGGETAGRFVGVDVKPDHETAT